MRAVLISALSMLFLFPASPFNLDCLGVTDPFTFCGARIQRNNDSYLAINVSDPINNSTLFKVRLFFRTRRADCVLFDAISNIEENLYISLNLIGGDLYYISQCPGAHRDYLIFNNNMKLNDDTFYSVGLEMDGLGPNKKVRVQVLGDINSINRPIPVDCPMVKQIVLGGSSAVLASDAKVFLNLSDHFDGCIMRFETSYNITFPLKTNLVSPCM